MKKADPGSELSAGTHIVSGVPCGVVSIILTAVAGTASTIKLYDHASLALGGVKKGLAIGAVNECAVYCPCQPDSFGSGCVAVVVGAGAKAYVSIGS